MNSSQIYESVFLNLYNDNEFKKNQQITYYNNSTKTALIVDPRFNPLMESVIRNFMYFLTPCEWNLCIVSYSGYENQIKSIFPNCIFKAIDQKYIFFKDNIPNITITNYNKIFLDINFWKELPGEHILIFQTDCIMYRMFDDYFLNYDFCGANFYNQPSVFYGGLNGGCSLRKKNAMIDCIVQFGTLLEEKNLFAYNSTPIPISNEKKCEQYTCVNCKCLKNVVMYKIDLLKISTKNNKLIKPDDNLHLELNHLNSLLEKNPAMHSVERSENMMVLPEEKVNFLIGKTPLCGHYVSDSNEGISNNCNRINEDVFFSHACERLLKFVPDKIHRTFFSIEADYNMSTCFHHGWNKLYQSKDNAIQIIKHSPFLCKYLTNVESSLLISNKEDKNYIHRENLINVAD